MGILIIVDADPVEGTDKHNVSGNAATNPPSPSAWVADYDYEGKITDQLSDFVNIGGAAIATVGSKSTLNPGGNAPPAGKHSGPQGSNFVPSAPPPVAISLVISDPVGDGFPSTGAGSGFVSIGGEAVLLDGDSIDTCDGLSTPENSTVTADGQDFVSCSE